MLLQAVISDHPNSNQKQRLSQKQGRPSAKTPEKAPRHAKRAWLRPVFGHHRARHRASCGLVDFIAAKANVGSGSKVAAVNVAFIAAVSMNLAPVLCRIKFLGQTLFAACFA